MAVAAAGGGAVGSGADVLVTLTGEGGKVRLGERRCCSCSVVVVVVVDINAEAASCDPSMESGRSAPGVCGCSTAVMDPSPEARPRLRPRMESEEDDDSFLTASTWPGRTVPQTVGLSIESTMGVGSFTRRKRRLEDGEGAIGRVTVGGGILGFTGSRAVIFSRMQSRECFCTSK